MKQVSARLHEATNNNIIKFNQITINNSLSTNDCFVLDSGECCRIVSCKKYLKNIEYIKCKVFQTSYYYNTSINSTIIGIYASNGTHIEKCIHKNELRNRAIYIDESKYDSPNPKIVFIKLLHHNDTNNQLN